MNFRWLNEIITIIIGVPIGIVPPFIALALAGLMIFTIPEIAKDNFEPIYFFIGTSITLGGLTMLSGIFENKNSKTKIEKALFTLSILFLTSAYFFILFIGLYSITKTINVVTSLREQVLIDSVVISYDAGLFLFVVGFALLIIILVKHRWQLSKSKFNPELSKDVEY
jgi:hypothetical protein